MWSNPFLLQLFMPDLWPLLLVLLLLIQFSVSSSILHSEFVCRRPEPMLESDAVRAPQTLSSLALDLAFSTPYKKNLKKTSFPGVSDSWRCSDLTSASVTSGHSLSLSSLHREKASFLHVSIDQEPFCLSRGILCTCGYTCQLTNHRQLFVCSVHVLFQDFCLFLPTFTHFTAHQLSRRWESRTRIDSSCSIISTC